MRVTISTGALFHAPHVATALQDAGLLDRIITSAATRAGWPDSCEEHFVLLRLPGLVGSALRRIPFADRFVQWNAIKDVLFDRLAARHVTGCDVLHVWSGYGLESMRAAAARGSVTVLERASCHVVQQNELIRTACGELGLRPPVVDEDFVRRQVAEYAEADIIVVPSSFVRDSMVEQGVDRGKLRLLPLGVDIDRFRPVRDRPAGFRIVSVGRVSVRKGTHLLLEAVRRLALRDVEVVLVGGVDPAFAPVLRRYDGLYRSVGGVAHAVLHEQYAAAHVCVVSSIEDGVPMAALEAMACGLPLVVSSHAGAADIIADGENGFVFPAGDVDALADRIRSMHGDDAKRARMGEAARRHVEERSWARHKEGLLRIYREAAAGRGGDS